MVARVLGVGWRSKSRDGIRGIRQRVMAWALPAVEDKRDPDYGWAMCRLACGHKCAGNYRTLAKRRPVSEHWLYCVLCSPRWIVHLREDDAERQKQYRRERKALRESGLEALFKELADAPPKS